MNVGIAVDTPEGLVVPVIRGADSQLGIWALAEKTQELGSGKSAPKNSRWTISAAGPFYHFQFGRPRRHRVHAHHQCARSGYFRRREVWGCSQFGEVKVLSPAYSCP